MNIRHSYKIDLNIGKKRKRVFDIVYYKFGNGLNTSGVKIWVENKEDVIYLAKKPLEAIKYVKKN